MGGGDLVFIITAIATVSLFSLFLPAHPAHLEESSLPLWERLSEGVTLNFTLTLTSPIEGEELL